MSAIDVISKIAPGLGTILGGPLGGIAGTLISSALGVDLKKPEEILKKIKEEPNFEEKLKKLEIDLKDLESARLEAANETGFIRYMRPMLVLLAFVALFVDVVFLAYVENSLVREILLVMMGILVFDIKQIYRFYFGGNGKDDVSAIIPFGSRFK